MRLRPKCPLVSVAPFKSGRPGRRRRGGCRSGGTAAGTEAAGAGGSARAGGGQRGWAQRLPIHEWLILMFFFVGKYIYPTGWQLELKFVIIRLSACCCECVFFRDFWREEFGEESYGLIVSAERLEYIHLGTLGEKQILQPLITIARWWFQIFFLFTPILGEMIQFD